MEPLVILQGVTLEQILSQFENIIERKFEEKIAQLNPSKKWHYMTRNEVANRLRITLPTLHDWTKLGFLNSTELERGSYTGLMK